MGDAGFEDCDLPPQLLGEARQLVGAVYQQVAGTQDTSSFVSLSYPLKQPTLAFLNVWEGGTRYTRGKTMVRPTFTAPMDPAEAG